MVVSPVPSIAFEEPVEDFFGVINLLIGSDYGGQPGALGRCQVLSHI
jgi:hypothetical protein